MGDRAGRIDLIRTLERLTCAAEAAQTVVTGEFDPGLAATLPGGLAGLTQAGPRTDVSARYPPTPACP
ncbi:hypothetical protein GCM10009844_09320 [Nocardioides koreensis]|uniref:DUF222 domain-containing protein n=1 Tax=Nocardioides koreensis TaxID=433651 RepID=A0ABP5L3J2_9ACTN